MEVSCNDAAEPDDSRLNPLRSEIPGGSSFQFSFPSQPPDIRNWFSSYEYESPESLGLPHSIDSFMLPQEGESETTDTLDDGAQEHDPSTSKNKYFVDERTWSQCPRIQNGSFPYPYSPISRDQKQELFLQAEEGNIVECDDGNEDDKQNDQYSVRRRNPASQSLLMGTIHSESASHQEQLEEIKLPIPEDHKGLAATADTMFSNFQDGFVSVKKRDAPRGSDQICSIQSKSSASSGTLDANCNSKVGCGCTGKQNESVQEILHPKPKRKLNLQKLLGDEILGNYTKEDGNDSIPKTQRTCLSSTYLECSLDVCPEKSKDIEMNSAKKSAIDNDKFSLDDAKQDEIGESFQEKQISQVSKDEESKENAATHSDFTAMKMKENSIDSPSARGRKTRHEHLKSGRLQLSKRYRALTCKEQAEGEKRSPFADKTNVVAAAASDVSGKWQCPRNTKPYTGPPLKQLRLERWVKRVDEHSSTR